MEGNGTLPDRLEHTPRPEHNLPRKNNQYTITIKTTTIMNQKEIEDIVTELESATASPATGNVNFCELWPKAKTILGLLASIPKLAIIVSILITVGDAYASRNCE